MTVCRDRGLIAPNIDAATTNSAADRDIANPTNGIANDGIATARGVVATNNSDITVLDLASGNLRFAVFLAASLPHNQLTIYAIDNCPKLVLPAEQSALLEAVKINYQNLDILEVLLADADLNAQLQSPLCDLSVAFGFLHHLPRSQDRQAVLASLIRQTRPGGLIIVTFWQFLKNPDLRAQAQDPDRHARAELGLPQLGEGDYLLGWNNSAGVYRYCHNFSDSEIAELVQGVANEARPLIQFSADGRSGDLNHYVIFQRQAD